MIYRFLVYAALLMGLAAFAVQPADASSRIKLRAELGQSAVLLRDGGRVFLRVDLSGIPFERRERRTPLNIALVIDRSGSMRGDKLERAKEAAVIALRRLAPNDIVSVIAYDHKVDVVVPATKLVDRFNFEPQIEQLIPGGRTALYAGVKRGLKEVRAFLRDHQVNRLVLLSDGLANVGPTTPSAIGALGIEAAKLGISVTTIGLGLGYNEDLMAKLAFNSDGNHAFVEQPGDLVRIFDREFGDALSVVAKDVEIIIDCLPGIVPMRALGREAKIDGRRVTLKFNQIYGAQNKYVLLELKLPKSLAIGQAPLAKVQVAYKDMGTKTRQVLKDYVAIRITASQTEADASVNKTVMASVVTQTAVAKNEMAVDLRDKGKIKEARKVLQENAAYLKRYSKRLSSPKLLELHRRNLDQAGRLDSKGWAKTRKAMRANQHRSKTQQAY